MGIQKNTNHLYADPKAVITQFLHLPGTGRIDNIINRVNKLSEKEVSALYKKLLNDFDSRHRNIKEIFTDNFERLCIQHKEKLNHDLPERALLLGAFFTKEYSIQSAALFNPSIVPHPDQQGLKQGEQRFIMSLRATGEGHISSIVFQTGIIDADGEIHLDKVPEYHTPLKKNIQFLYKKEMLEKNGDLKKIISLLPAEFIADEAIELAQKKYSADESVKSEIELMKEILDSNYELLPSSHIPLNERVIFPGAKAESMGMEDVRFVQFNDNGKIIYYGSYTAYDGRQIRSQLIETDDFNVFKIHTMYGKAVSDKGMALLPEKVNGKYVMISRQGGELINIMFSDDLYKWDSYKTLMEPLYDWELVQLGNCGSPVKTEKGWLLLTHGVGIMRTYVISAIVLDLHDPSVIIARMDKPLIVAEGDEREGYVPNVVYTCGLLKHGEYLVIPYAVSDSATAFAKIKTQELLNEMNYK